ncbi:MAG: hypothetical protein NWE76_02610 [Candidatus Bathyarchaeota archaeon]|nr:hypothetical protein [Candidatus Bathyarchaeota archaeon]
MDEISEVDLNETLWSLSFPCPRCGEPIFPEGEAGSRLDLLEVSFNRGEVKRAIIRCTSCGRPIRLVGLDVLSRMGCFEKL